MTKKKEKGGGGGNVFSEIKYLCTSPCIADVYYNFDLCVFDLTVYNFDQNGPKMSVFPFEFC